MGDLDNEDRLLRAGDLPPEMIAEMTEVMEGMFPGMEVKFAGDETDPDVIARVSDLNRRLTLAIAESFVNGECFDCGRSVPADANWPDDGLPEDWKCFSDTMDPEATMGLQCPQCDAAEAEGCNPVNIEELLKNYEARKAARN